MLVANNRIQTIDVNLASAIPNLRVLALTGNSLAELSQLEALRNFNRLEFLSLIGNPVTAKKNYREWVINACPTVRFLDFKKIKDKVT